MTDDLVKRLRMPSSAIHRVTQRGIEWTVTTDIDTERAEAADAIEAQAKRIAELEAALIDARNAALEEAAIEIERVGHKTYPNKLITDGYANSVRFLKAHSVSEPR